MRLKEILEEAEGLEKEIETLDWRLSHLLHECARQLSPVKPGDVATVPDYMWEYIGKTAKVLKVRAGRLDQTLQKGCPVAYGGWCWKVDGKVLKKDGTPARDGMAYVDWVLPMTGGGK